MAGCAAPYEGPASPHFDGKVLSHPGVVKQSSVLGDLWLRLTSAQAEWPSSVAVPAAAAPVQRVHTSEGVARVTLIGHATLLIQVAGLNILTDPVWSERASLGIDLAAVWLVVDQDLPPLAAALARMFDRTCHEN